MKVEGLLSLVGPEPGTGVVGSPYFYLGNVLSVIAFLGTLGGLKGYTLYKHQAMERSGVRAS